MGCYTNSCRTIFMSDQRARRQALRLVHATDTDMRGLPFKARFEYPGEADASDEEKMRRSRDDATPAEKWTPTAEEVQWAEVSEAWRCAAATCRDSLHQYFWGTDLGHDTGTSSIFGFIPFFADVFFATRM